MDLSSFLSGAVFMACCSVGMFFLNYWKTSRDRFFGVFSCAFWILAIERLVQLCFRFPVGQESKFFLIRLLAFSFIIAAIWDKNRGSGGKIHSSK